MANVSPRVASRMTPEMRVAILAEAIRYTAGLEGSVDALALHRYLIEWCGLPEEDCSFEIMAATLLIVRSGLYESNTFNQPKQAMVFRVGTTLTPSSSLIAYVHGEPAAGDEDGGDAA